VWPLITFTLVYVLRAHLREAFARMTRVETPAGSIEFAVEARDVLNHAESAGDSAGPVTTRSGPRQAHGVPAPAGPPPDNGQNTDYPLPAPAGSGHGHPPGHAPGGFGHVHPQPGQPAPGGPSYSYPQPGQPGSFGPVVLHPVPGASHPVEQRPGSVWRSGFRVARDVADSLPAAAVVTAWDVLERLCREVVLVRGLGWQPADVASLGRGAGRVRAARRQRECPDASARPARPRPAPPQRRHTWRRARRHRRLPRPRPRGRRTARRVTERGGAHHPGRAGPPRRPAFGCRGSAWNGLSVAAAAKSKRVGS
jgi:hypothetical protein